MRKLKSGLILIVILNIVVFCFIPNREDFNSSIKSSEHFNTSIEHKNMKRSMSTQITPSHVEWKFIIPPELSDGSDGKLLTEELRIPLWDVSVYENPSFPQPKFNKSLKYTLIILVNSAVANSHLRQNIRDTWGKLSPSEYLTFFSVGKSGNESLDELIYNEIDEYGDIILGDFHDSYENNTIKTILGYQMALKMFQFRFLLKTDDDILLNPRAIIENLKPLNEKVPIYAGSSVRLPKLKKIPRANNCTKYDCKWALTKSQWPFDYNVDFARGLAAIFTRSTIEILLEGYKFVPYLHTDDSYIGYVLKRRGVTFCEIGKQRIKDKWYYPLHKDICKYAEVYAMHYRGVLWSKLVSDRVMKSWSGCTLKRKAMFDSIRKCYPNTQLI